MIQCFWCEPTGKQMVSLRRYALKDEPCPSGGNYHNAMVPIGEQDERFEIQPSGYKAILNPEHVAHDDWRWPRVCPCGYVFTEEDCWQEFGVSMYRRADTGVEFSIRDAPPGALWDAWWWGKATGHTAPDGLSLMCQTPDGEWNVDGPSNNGSGWTRTGDPKANPPTVTANPSIQCRSYHGWLRDGKLVDAKEAS